jgi:hypothetical protein
MASLESWEFGKQENRRNELDLKRRGGPGDSSDSGESDWGKNVTSVNPQNRRVWTYNHCG